jgi:DNA-binding transcriptional LysR family regulator
MDQAAEMRVFVSAIDRGSFSAAAEELELTPSAVSKLVTRLENRLGVRLLNRTTRRLALTTEGEVYAGRARRILADIDDAEAEVARARGAPRGKLRINSGTAFGLHQLAPALAGFLDRYPEIEIDLSITDRLVDLIETNADIAVRSGHVTDSSYVMRKIADLQRVICAAPSYLQRCGTPRTVADLRKHDCILHIPGLHHWPFRTRAGTELIEIAPRVTTDDAEAALRLAIEGAGIVRLADVIAAEPIRQGRLAPVLADVHHVEQFPLAAIYPAGRHRLPKVRVFLDFLVERFGQAPWRTS